MPSSKDIEELRLLDELHVRRCLSSDFYWLTRGTSTEDEQDPKNPIKPFPPRDYFQIILSGLADESVFFVEKSRTMMLTWLVTGFSAHYGFTHPYTGVVFHSKDEDRAVHCVKCVKILWRESCPLLKETWRLRKPLDEQPYNKFELANGSRFTALPGDPDKVRHAHPTMVILDEAALLPDFYASFDIAAATRCLKIIALSSANPGGFRDTTKDAQSQAFPATWIPRAIQGQIKAASAVREKPRAAVRQKPSLTATGHRDWRAWYPERMKLARENWRPSAMEPVCGLRMRRTESGAPVVYLHYSADPAMDEPKLGKELSRYTSEANWKKEMEIDYEALSGALVYPEYDESIHVVPDSLVPRRLCRYMAIDPHPRTPHAFLWIGIDAWQDWWIYRELWPSIVCGQSRQIRDDEVDNSYTVKEYAETLAHLEGNKLKFSRVGEDFEYATYLELQGGERIVYRFMDQAGKAFRASGESQKKETYTARYKRYGIACRDPKKSHEVGEDAVRELLKPRMSDGSAWPRIHIAESCSELRLEMKGYRYMMTKTITEEKDLKQAAVQARCHLIDNLRYIATSGATWIPSLVS